MAPTNTELRAATLFTTNPHKKLEQKETVATKKKTVAFLYSLRTTIKPKTHKDKQTHTPPKNKRRISAGLKTPHNPLCEDDPLSRNALCIQPIFLSRSQTQRTQTKQQHRKKTPTKHKITNTKRCKLAPEVTRVLHNMAKIRHETLKRPYGIKPPQPQPRKKTTNTKVYLTPKDGSCPLLKGTAKETGGL